MHWIHKTKESTVHKLREFVLNDSFGIAVSDGKDLSIAKTSWPDECRNEENDNRFLSLFDEYYWKDYVTWFENTFNAIPTLGTVWYQVYEHGDSHDWHRHAGTTQQYANVLYLSLPCKTLTTQFRDSFPEAEEGDTLVFNPFEDHCSPINHTFSPKIVIAFNVIWKTINS